MRSGSVTFWSWTASVGFHVVVLAGLGVWKLSDGSKTAAARQVPSATVANVATLSGAEPVISKPKVSRFAGGHISEASEVGGAITGLFAGAELGASEEKIVIARAADLTADAFAASTAASPRTVEFFGSSTGERKICYVVDCSASMQGMFGRVQMKLKESIGQLRPNQYFYVVFFGGNSLLESGDGRLVRATDKAKANVYEFIDSVRPTGQTNAAAGLARAMQIRGEGGERPSAVYFLTDGFELDQKRAEAFGEEVAQMLKSNAPTMKINAIGFWPDATDRVMLERIAESSGGQAVFVTEDR